MKKLLTSLLVLSMFSGINAITLNADSTNEILVGQAKTIEEKADVALNNITLNTDLNNVVTNLLVPLEGLYESSIVWSSSNEDYAYAEENNTMIKITRPSFGENAVEVTLTATLTIYESKTSNITKTKDFKIRILPIDKEADASSTSEFLFSEDFSVYPVGEDIGEYLAWDLSSGEGNTKIVNEVPNNNLVKNQQALQINSTKTAKDINYSRRMYTASEIVVEAYTMFYGELNGIFFEFGKDGSYGPMFGLDHESFYYYSNGDSKFDTEKVPMTPTEGVWSKFRLEINPSKARYSLKMYKMDETADVYTVADNSLYSRTNKEINCFRIRVEGGDKVGEVYLSDLRIAYKDEMPITAEENPNRELGIGEVKNFQSDVLYIKDSPVTYDKNIEVYNRFNKNQLYTKDTDYTIATEEVPTTDGTKHIKYTITLLATNEVKELYQTIYTEDANGIPYIDEFKGSHLAKEKLADGTLSSTGNITFKGLVTRDDGTIYYGLATNKLDNISEEVLVNGGSNFVASGSFLQSSRNVEYTIKDLDLKKTYYLYVLIKNSNGSSTIYSKEEISEVINITTCEEFYDMTVNVTTYQNEFRLLNDLDFSNYTWKCDPTNTLKWEGVLDGQGHTITNLNIESPYRKAAVFFEITDATIKNLNFKNCTVYGLQDSAIVCGYSNGGTIENISMSNCKVNYNNNEGSEGYFALVAGRLHKETTNMTNIFMEKCYIDCNKYTGALTGNVNKGNNCVLNATNIYADVGFNCDGAAVGLVGRNRGTTNIENAIAYIDVDFAKKEMGVVAGHNKEGGKLNVKNFIGKLEVGECTQPTYFNNFIGSHDMNTSSYTFENVYFFDVDYSHISDSITPTTNTRTCGKMLGYYGARNEQWWEENTFIDCFETDSVWSYNEKTKTVEFVFNKQINVTADMVNEHIAAIKDDYSKQDHYHMYQALTIYEALSSTEKAKVNKSKLDESKKKYEDFLSLIGNIK